jgi:hypothetical protein
MTNDKTDYWDYVCWYSTYVRRSERGERGEGRGRHRRGRPSRRGFSTYAIFFAAINSSSRRETEETDRDSLCPTGTSILQLHKFSGGRMRQEEILLKLVQGEDGKTWAESLYGWSLDSGTCVVND